MENLPVGYYIIEQDGFLLPARWDGNMWNHERGKSSPREGHKNVKYPVSYSCPLGCTCTVNPDGSIHVDCG